MPMYYHLSRNKKDAFRSGLYRSAVQLLGLWSLGCVCLVLLHLAKGTLRAEESQQEQQAPIKLVTLLTEDGEGKPLRFPSTVAYDRDQDEIYVVNSGSGGVIVYDRDFFPHLSLGPGRGINAPQGIFFDNKQGDIYICQGNTPTHPARVTVLNGAFLPKMEITFVDMADPEAAAFIPARGAIGKNDIIYLVGPSNRGALKIDKNGTFMGWLKPMESITQQDEDEEIDPEEESFLAGNDEPEPELSTDESITESEIFGLPSELLPKKKGNQPRRKNSRNKRAVQLNDIRIDREGHIFLLSQETSKVYVYGANEELLYSFGQKGGSAGKMSRPRGLAVDEKKQCVYVVDYMRHTILVYDNGGKFVYEFGGRGYGPLWFNFPTALSVDRLGRLIVSDLFNNRIQILEVRFDTSFPLFQNNVNIEDSGNDLKRDSSSAAATQENNSTER